MSLDNDDYMQRKLREMLWVEEMLKDVEGNEFIKEFFMPEDLVEYIRSRCPHGGIYEWDDPIDWITGVSLGLAFNYREYFATPDLEMKFRAQVAYLTGTILRGVEKPNE